MWLYFAWMRISVASILLTESSHLNLIGAASKWVKLHGMGATFGEVIVDTSKIDTIRNLSKFI